MLKILPQLFANPTWGEHNRQILPWAVGRFGESFISGVNCGAQWSQWPQCQWGHKGLPEIHLEETKMSQPVLSLPHMQHPAEGEIFIPPPPPVFPSITFQAIFSILAVLLLLKRFHSRLTSLWHFPQIHCGKRLLFGCTQIKGQKKPKIDQ